MDKFDELAENEVLFEYWWNFLCYKCDRFEESRFMDLWAEAKDMAINVLGSKKVLLKFRREISMLRYHFTNQFLGFEDEPFDAIFCCATTMIIISGKKDEVDGIRDEFAQEYYPQENKIAMYATYLINRIEAGEIKKDYDYSKVDGGIKDETITQTITKADAGTAENNETLLEKLMPIFYGNKEQAEVYIKKFKNITNDVEKVQYTAQLVNENTISEMSCHRDLYRILHDHGLYNKSESNWNKVISQYLVKK